MQAGSGSQEQLKAAAILRHPSRHRYQDKQTSPVTVFFAFFLSNFRMLGVPTGLACISLLTGYSKIANQDYVIQSTLISIKKTPPQIIINIEKVRAVVTGD